MHCFAHAKNNPTLTRGIYCIVFNLLQTRRKLESKVTHGKRPEYDDQQIASAFGTLCVTVMNECWADDYTARPTFADVVNKVGYAWEWDGIGMPSQRAENTDGEMQKAAEGEIAAQAVYG